MQGFDATAVHWLNHLAWSWEPLRAAAELLSSDYLIPMLAVAALLYAWLAGRTEEERARRQRGALAAMLALAICNVAVTLLAERVGRVRPFVAIPDVRVLFYRPTDFGFPSNSVAAVAALGAGLWPAYRRPGLLLVLGSLVLGAARVAVGVHYPTDVLGGLAMGVVAALLAWWLLRAFPVVARTVRVVARAFSLG